LVLPTGRVQPHWAALGSLLWGNPWCSAILPAQSQSSLPCGPLDMALHHIQDHYGKWTKGVAGETGQRELLLCPRACGRPGGRGLKHGVDKVNCELGGRAGAGEFTV
jgi:hypothetical protein